MGRKGVFFAHQRELEEIPSVAPECVRASEEPFYEDLSSETVFIVRFLGLSGAVHGSVSLKSACF